MAYTVSVNTAQNVKLNYELAGVGTRILAYILDALIMSAYIVLVVVLFMYFFFEKMNLDDDTLIVIGILFYLPILIYSFVFEALFNGQTPGKKIMKIKVVRVDGSSPTIGNYFMRWLLQFVDFQCFSGLVAIIAISTSEKGQRLGDMAAGTTVIYAGPDYSFNDIPLLHVAQEYEPTYSEAVKLSDKDISIIQQILQNSQRTYNPEALAMTVRKVKEVTGITEIKQTDGAFLTTILKDYNYLVAE